MSDDALKLLRALKWLPNVPSSLVAPARDWLLEKKSLTKRFENYCNNVTIKLLNEVFVNTTEVGEELLFLPREQHYWLREVVLFGDDKPWLAGRTLVPESILNGSEKKLLSLGSRPLGHYLFSSPALTRDFIECGTVESLWGRRSRLRLADKPLIITELFLHDAPIYQYSSITNEH